MKVGGGGRRGGTQEDGRSDEKGRAGRMKEGRKEEGVERSYKKIKNPI